MILGKVICYVNVEIIFSFSYIYKAYKKLSQGSCQEGTSQIPLIESNIMSMSFQSFYLSFGENFSNLNMYNVHTLKKCILGNPSYSWSSSSCSSLSSKPSGFSSSGRYVDFNYFGPQMMDFTPDHYRENCEACLMGRCPFPMK